MIHYIALSLHDLRHIIIVEMSKCHSVLYSMPNIVYWADNPISCSSAVFNWLICLYYDIFHDLYTCIIMCMLIFLNVDIISCFSFFQDDEVLHCL